MTKWAVHTLYTQTAHRVHTAAVLAILTALPADAQITDTFATFETRCLTPMIEVRESDTTGLRLVAEDDGSEIWMVDGAGWHMVHATSDAVIQFCAVHGAIGTGVDVWAEAAVASGDWITIDRTPETLQSTFIREPRIELEIDRLGESLTVIETNLES